MASREAAAHELRINGVKVVSEVIGNVSAVLVLPKAEESATAGAQASQVDLEAAKASAAVSPHKGPREHMPLRVQIQDGIPEDRSRGTPVASSRHEGDHAVINATILDRKTLGRKSMQAVTKLGPIAAHALVVIAMALADLTQVIAHPGPVRRDKDWNIGLALVLLYVVLVISLLASGLAALARPSRRLWQHEWLVLTGLHVGTAFLSGVWREEIGLNGQRTPAVVAIYMLLLASLYPCSAVGPVLIAVSAVTTVAVLCSVRQQWMPADTIDGVLIVGSVGAAATVLGSALLPSGVVVEQPREEEEKGRCQEDLILQLAVSLAPILDGEAGVPALVGSGLELTTALDRLVTRLMRTETFLQKNKKLHPEAGQLLGNLCKTLLTELSNLSQTKVYVGELTNASPMTHEYVHTVLNQSPESLARGMPATLGTKSRPPLAFPSSSGDLPLSSSSPSRPRAGVGESQRRRVLPASSEEERGSGRFLKDRAVARVGSSSSNRPPSASNRPPSASNRSPAGYKHQAGGAAGRGSSSPVEELRAISNGALDSEKVAVSSVDASPVALSSYNSEAGAEDAAVAPLLQEAIEENDESAEVDMLELEDPETTFDSAVQNMMSEFYPPFQDEDLGPFPTLTEELEQALGHDLGMWRFDIFKLSQYCSRHPLTVIGSRALEDDIASMGLEEARVMSFLQNIEQRYYQVNPYHNSMHGADVMNSMIYFLKLAKTPFSYIEPVERLAALISAGCHDVGHAGRANRFHITTLSPLAMLYNDQSPLENMHSAITFSVLYASSCNFLVNMEAPLRATFRAVVTLMILETDLGKHIQTIGRFRQEFLHKPEDQKPKLDSHTSAQKKELLAFALKCCDVAHSTKPFDLHLQWTLRINNEFFIQGDAERELGLQCSPFCDRFGTHVSESQRGFFDFIVAPLYTAMDEHIGSKRLQMEVMPEMEKNRAFWKMYNGSSFNYEDPESSAETLQREFCSWEMERRNTAMGNKTERGMPKNLAKRSLTTHGGVGVVCAHEEGEGADAVQHAHQISE